MSKKDDYDFLELCRTIPESELTYRIESGYDVNTVDQKDMTALMYAARENENPKIVSLLIKAGAKIDAQDSQGMTALMHAARDNTNPNVVAELIKAGANVNAQDFKGRTALIHMVLDTASPVPPCFENVVTMLAEAGANDAIRDHSGKDVWGYLKAMGLGSAYPPFFTRAFNAGKQKTPESGNTL